MAEIRQTSFASGELSPYLHGRTDLDLYAHGARRMLNFFANRQGAAISRPGSRKAWQARDANVVLVPYLAGGGESLILEFGNLYVRAYNSRTLAGPIELATPFRTQDLPDLQWAQTGLVLLVTHPAHPPQEITFAAAASIVEARFAPLGDTPGAAPLEAVMPSIDGNPPKMHALVEWQPTTLFVVDAQHPPREWKYKVSTLVRHILTGEVIETLPRDVTEYSAGNVSSGIPTGALSALPADNLLILFPDAPIYLAPGYSTALGGSTSLTTATHWQPIEYLYYRGRGRLFGLIGSSNSNALFADFADEPDYLTPPLRGESPFKAGEYPVATAFFQQRRFFAGSYLRPSTWWASAVDSWNNYDAPILNWHGQPLEVTLAARKRERIVSMVASEQLFVFTDTSAWVIGARETPIDYDALSARVIDEVGAAPLQPLVVDGSILYVRAKGRGVRAISHGDAGGFIGSDISWHAEHLFRGTDARIVSWCYARDPWGVVWAVRADGALISCTRTGSGTWAWARHQTGGSTSTTGTIGAVTGLSVGPSIALGRVGDRVLSVASVPQSDSTTIKGDFDVVFIAVEREGGTFVERMTPHTVDDPVTNVPDAAGNIHNPIGREQISYPVDSHIIVTGANTIVGEMRGGLNHLRGRAVWAVCPGLAPQGPLIVNAAGEVPVMPWLDESGAVLTGLKVAIGLPFTADLESLDAAQARMNQKTVVTAGFEVDNSTGLQAGQDFEHLVPWVQRAVADSYSYPSAATALVKLKVTGTWSRSGRVVLRQATPQAVTVLGITREAETGGS